MAHILRNPRPKPNPSNELVFIIKKFEVTVYLKSGEIINGYWRAGIEERGYYVNEIRIEIHKNTDSIIGIPINNVSHYEVERVKEYLK